MKTAEKDILEVEDPVKKARAQKAFEALNHIFSGKENGLIKVISDNYNYLSATTIITEEKSQKTSIILEQKERLKCSFL